MTRDGIKVCCRLPDFVQTYIYLFGIWEPDLVAYLRRRLQPGDTLIDVGAHIGYVSTLASRLVGPDGTVVAIEPFPEVLASLEQTLSSNCLSNVRVIAAAVSDREDQVPLFAARGNSGLTTTVARRGFREEYLVRAAPLASLVTREELETARVIKIDVEGAEDRVLASLIEDIDTLDVDVDLIVELSPTWWSESNLRPIDVLRPFFNRGFHLYELPNDYAPWRYLWPNDVRAPRRVRDLDRLERRVKRLDAVLSRRDVDSL
ncbi:hypothetical protein A5698_26635 [Mycobacterium sp. E136]|nr:FkbM family methyltransferase [Mycobacterium sp. E136]OBG87243.1 hypothetical protein A5698_26635 [Mycobacterium sp. E136]